MFSYFFYYRVFLDMCLFVVEGFLNRLKQCVLFCLNLVFVVDYVIFSFVFYELVFFVAQLSRVKSRRAIFAIASEDY